MTKKDLKVLLIQIRPDDMVHHEYGLIKRFGELEDWQIKRINAIERLPIFKDLDDINVLIVGGAGDYLLTKGDVADEVEAIGGVLKEARKRQIPILAICFGAQILAKVFGGSVYYDAETAETGTFPVSRNGNSESCSIFSEMPKTFFAQLGHQDHIGELPEGAVCLASSERSKNQAFTFPGEPIYAVSFHPELDEEAILYRMNYYSKKYPSVPDDIEEMKKCIFPTPYTPKIFSLFLENIVLGGERYPVEKPVDKIVD